MKITLITPASRESRQGNRVTAYRWARLLRELGHQVKIQQAYWGKELCDVLIALHALKSFSSIHRFRKAHPNRPLIVALTGTDLYGKRLKPPPISWPFHQALAWATRVVVLQPLAKQVLPKSVFRKTHIIYQSAQGSLQKSKPKKDIFEVGVIAHLRPVKDPLRAAYAVRGLPANSHLQVIHIGKALTPALAQRTRAEMSRNPRYRWLDEVPRSQAQKILARLHLLVLSSKAEGGANVLSEALAARVPILSTRIPGSMGILGSRYPGYFPVGDTRGLRNLLQRAEKDLSFYRRLQRAIWKRRSLVQVSRERQSWKRLLAHLT